MRRNNYLPEGVGPLFPEGQDISALRDAMNRREILEGMAIRCDSRRDLFLRLGGFEGRIPRQEAVHPAISGADRDIAVLSRVGKPTCCVITDIQVDGGGRPQLTLSRRMAQERAMTWLLEDASPGRIFPARVTHLEQFGAFVDLGCGFTSLLPTDRISVARISHPAARFRVGDDILVLTTAVDRETQRIYLSHRELLGTWLQNAAGFSPGDTVTGVVRSVRDYGIFIELAPNLTGLAEWRPGLRDGEAVSVYIKSIRAEGRKVKLQIIEHLGPAGEPGPLRYFTTDGTLEEWAY